MGINSATKEQLEKMSNLELLDYLLHIQYEADTLFNDREKNKNNFDEYMRLHSLYYDKVSEVIEVKYMVARRMKDTAKEIVNEYIEGLDKNGLR